MEKNMEKQEFERLCFSNGVFDNRKITYQKEFRELLNNQTTFWEPRSEYPKERGMFTTTYTNTLNALEETRGDRLDRSLEGTARRAL